MKMKHALTIVLALAVWVSTAAAQNSWQAKLEQELPLLGHRNWIVIVDSAYPLQTSPGVETIETNSGLLQVVQVVLQELDRVPHVEPVVHTDRELRFLQEQEAPGVTAYREQLKTMVGNRAASSQPHLDLINTLAETGKTFHVLVLKTTATIPYSSVFLELNCKYWTPAAEKDLRDRMLDGRKR